MRALDRRTKEQPPSGEVTVVAQLLLQCQSLSPDLFFEQPRPLKNFDCGESVGAAADAEAGVRVQRELSAPRVLLAYNSLVTMARKAALSFLPDNAAIPRTDGSFNRFEECKSTRER